MPHCKLGSIHLSVGYLGGLTVDMGHNVTVCPIGADFQSHDNVGEYAGIAS